MALASVQAWVRLRVVRWTHTSFKRRVGMLGRVSAASAKTSVACTQHSNVKKPPEGGEVLKSNECYSSNNSMSAL